MEFNKLVDFWVACLSDNRENTEYSSAYEKADDTFRRLDIPGGGRGLLFNDQEMIVDADITAFVDGCGGGHTMYDHFINFRPRSKKSRAARIAAKRQLSQDVPEIMFSRAIKTRFGWEIIQLPLDWENLSRIILRPRLTKTNNLSRQYWCEWVNQLDDLSGDQTDMLLALSGPRQESFLKIILGDDWKNCISI